MPNFEKNTNKLNVHWTLEMKLSTNKQMSSKSMDEKTPQKTNTRPEKTHSFELLGRQTNCASGLCNNGGLSNEY